VLSPGQAPTAPPRSPAPHDSEPPPLALAASAPARRTGVFCCPRHYRHSLWGTTIDRSKTAGLGAPAKAPWDVLSLPPLCSQQRPDPLGV
jgi:hypothetical protein